MDNVHWKLLNDLSKIAISNLELLDLNDIQLIGSV